MILEVLAGPVGMILGDPEGRLRAPNPVVRRDRGTEPGGPGGSGEPGSHGSENGPGVWAGCRRVRSGCQCACT